MEVMTHQPLKLHRRVGHGTYGQKVVALTNSFAVKLPERPRMVYYYDVDMQPLFQVDPEKKFIIGPRKGLELMTRLQTNLRPDLFNPRGAFDGKKSLWVTRSLNFQYQKFDVPWNEGCPGKRPKLIAIHIKYVHPIRLDAVTSASSPEVIHMLNVFVQVAPAMKWPHNARAFFSHEYGSVRLQGLELWRGLFQSVRPTMDRLVINVDVTVGAIMPIAPLNKISADYLQLREMRALNKLSDDEFRRLRHFLKGVKIRIDLPLHKGRKPLIISDLVRNAGSRTLTTTDDTMTISTYFAEVHRQTVAPNELGVLVGNGAVFPMRFCITVLQLWRKKLAPDAVREAMKFTPRNPRERMAAIARGWKYLEYENSDFVQNVGLEISKEPIMVKGRILPGPSLEFEGQYKLNEPGVWSMVKPDKRFKAPARIGSHWAVVDFGGTYVHLAPLQKFVSDLVRVMAERGMDANPPAITRSAPIAETIEKTLYEEGRKYKATFMLVILPENAPEPYMRVKRWGDITQGVATQCVRWKHEYNSRPPSNQYINNLLLKINGKVGGTNFSPTSGAMSELAKEPTIVFGADVSHPPPGEATLPSAASLVSSWDKAACRYVASIELQECRREEIADLGCMVKKSLQSFKEARNPPPTRAFFYRDGVSEGELERACAHEIHAIKEAFREVIGQRPPRLTYIVCGKRHHTRFQPHQAEAADHTGNCKSGFVVDQDIVHPQYNDFFLQSQAGLKGTSRPGHYTIVLDENNLPPDAIQKLTYDLSHCYARATRSVSQPAAVQYAHLVSRRARFHLDPSVQFGDDASINSGRLLTLEEYKAHFNEISHNMSKDRMYFL